MASVLWYTEVFKWDQLPPCQLPFCLGVGTLPSNVSCGPTVVLHAFCEVAEVLMGAAICSSREWVLVSNLDVNSLVAVASDLVTDDSAYLSLLRTTSFLSVFIKHSMMEEREGVKRELEDWFILEKEGSIVSTSPEFRRCYQFVRPYEVFTELCKVETSYMSITVYIFLRLNSSVQLLKIRQL